MYLLIDLDTGLSVKVLLEGRVAIGVGQEVEGAIAHLAPTYDHCVQQLRAYSASLQTYLSCLSALLQGSVSS